jgi:uncharacterized protein YjiS (DUF1127 family)
MAVVYQDSVASSGFHPAQGVGAWISRRVAAFADRRRRAREMHDLAMFTDRDLWDVGLSRSDLMAIEKGIYRRD